ncbi:MAG: hypothetical protein KGK17_08285 [Betaproteobacteria bacterium]|nr:hypothetical protein [Betaproteobacteria bacterium]
MKPIDNTNDPSDKHILLPITTTLNKYVELKTEQEKAKNRRPELTIVTIISFIVGATSFCYTLKSPSTDDMKRAVEQVLSEKSANRPAQ